MQLQSALSRAFDIADSGDPSALEDADHALSYLGTRAEGLARRLGAGACWQG
jgi:hypothetical protein